MRQKERKEKRKDRKGKEKKRKEKKKRQADRTYEVKLSTRNNGREIDDDDDDGKVEDDKDGDDSGLVRDVPFISLLNSFRDDLAHNNYKKKVRSDKMSVAWHSQRSDVKTPSNVSLEQVKYKTRLRFDSNYGNVH